MSYYIARVIESEFKFKRLALDHNKLDQFATTVAETRGNVFLTYKFASAVFFILSFYFIIERDFDGDYLIVPIESQAMHFPYWAYFVLTLYTVLHFLSILLYCHVSNLDRGFPEWLSPRRKMAGDRRLTLEQLQPVRRAKYGSLAVVDEIESSELAPPLYRVVWVLHNVALVTTPLVFLEFLLRHYEGYLYSNLPDWSSADFYGWCLHMAGTVYLLVDFIVSGLPFRLLHFYQPLTFTIVYQVVLVIFTSLADRNQPYIYFITSYGHSYETFICAHLKTNS